MTNFERDILMWTEIPRNLWFINNNNQVKIKKGEVAGKSSQRCSHVKFTLQRLQNEMNGTEVTKKKKRKA